MPASRFPTGVAPAVLALLALATPAAAQPRAPAPQRTAATAPNLLDAVAPAYRDAVAGVIRQPTLTAKAADDEFLAHHKVYEWMLDHPDRVSLAWKRLKVPCVDITELKDGRFHWADGDSELTWQTVGRFADGVIWYATGKVKPAALLPTAPVKAVAVLHHPKQVTDGQSAVLAPTVSVYLLTDSRAATAILRMVGPAAPRMAEQGAEQLLLFFSGPARHLYKHPDEVQTLLAPKGK